MIDNLDFFVWEGGGGSTGTLKMTPKTGLTKIMRTAFFNVSKDVSGFRQTFKAFLKWPLWKETMRLWTYFNFANIEKNLKFYLK